MGSLKKVYFLVGFIVCFPLVYVLLSLLLSYIPSSFKTNNTKHVEHTVFVSSNGVHLDIIIPKDEVSSSIKQDLVKLEDYNYLAFGWGDKGFYINTPTWGDLTFKTAFVAMFWKSETLMHVTKYKFLNEDWIPISLDERQFQQLLVYINSSFDTSTDGKVLLHGKSYGNNDEFYEAVGNYSCFKTCNTWANSALKSAEVRTAIWTPFDFGVLHFIK